MLYLFVGFLKPVQGIEYQYFRCSINVISAISAMGFATSFSGGFIRQMSRKALTI
jgi:hypothetical protein